MTEPVRTDDPNADLRRGWCPGARRPMETGDGFVLRLRLSGGRLPLATAATIAALARRFGSGAIDLSGRGNLQIRGVPADNVGPLQEALADHGLIDSDPAREAVRNIVASPLAGLGDGAHADIGPLLATLEAGLMADPRLQTLPAKFSWVVDNGGALALDGIDADLRLRAIAPDRFAIGAGGPSGIRWLGATGAGDAAAAALAIARSFAALADRPRRLHRLDGPGLAMIAREALPVTPRSLAREPAEPLHSETRPPPVPAGPLPASPLPANPVTAGPVTVAGRTIALLAAPPFGALDAGLVEGLASLAARHRVPELRLTPFRAIAIPLGGAAPAIADLTADLAALGFILDPADPALAIVACPGAPACRSATTPTRAEAATLAARLRAARWQATPGLPPLVHISGCRKGCAHPRAAPLTLVAEAGRYGLMRDAAPSAPPSGHLASTELAETVAAMLIGEPATLSTTRDRNPE